MTPLASMYQASGGKPIFVSSRSMSASSWFSSLYGSPLPPASRASRILGNALRSTRWPCTCMVMVLGRLTGDPMTKGAAPSQAEVFSMQAMDL